MAMEALAMEATTTEAGSPGHTTTYTTATESPTTPATETRSALAAVYQQHLHWQQWRLQQL